MGKLTDEQARQLQELQALAEAPDAEEEFEVVIEDGGKRMTVPWSKLPGSWRTHFGFEDPAAAAGEGDQGDGDQGKGDQGKGDPKPGSNNRYFA
jgi:hypothetical protein